MVVKYMLDDDRPIFQQLADRIAAGIIAKEYPEGTAVPSINELAVFFKINPATANKAVNLLVDREVIEKRRGVGMFVLPGAREKLIAARRKDFAHRHLDPMIKEATYIGLTTEELIDLIKNYTPQE